ncbi:phosphoribosyltransferase [Candidatus Bathyarchaeota archaeon]|nr:phosphoribosyltransferase [Candidatus Bathyarchaeota archaeon]NIU81476.1 phosphoribosyltransferase [Candidatus Bathyarchaeota archaeon]NIV68122.1 phosphoribosyltransferase [Candidatus Bathyarchaeota archaeon]NIW16032.1 phosphoribosyltransferase [Candidatus Bathyarchaeota archaeon]NIW34633.1 phosphoribosyltransferase [Candidatus Bathyarchaeota archaeon]
MNTEPELVIPSWDQIYGFLLNLAEKIREDSFEPHLIVGVSRGGWPPARVMSDLLETPQIANVKAEFYVGVAQSEGEPVITQPVSASVEDKKVLVVDDVADTGKSLSLVDAHLRQKGAAEVKIATIYYKPWSIVVPHYYQRETSSWVVFPWERKETVRNILQRYQSEEKPIRQAKEKLVRSGLDPELVERFVQEILEG